MGRSGPRVAQRSLGGGPWIIAAAGIDRALARLDAECPRVGTRFRARLGVKTGLDRVFLDPPDAVEAEHRRPAVRGRDIRAFHVTPARELLWTHDERGVVCERLGEGARRHLTAHERALRRRADYRDGPFWTLFRTEAALARHRVVWADLARRLEASVLAGPLARAVPLNTAYVIAAADRPGALRLAAWLNTTWIRALARARATRAASGFARFNAALVESLPLPDAVLHDDSLLAIGGQALGGGFDQRAANERGARLLSLTRAEQSALGSDHAPDR
jgi:hypothetical protein